MRSLCHLVSYAVWSLRRPRTERLVAAHRAHLIELAYDMATLNGTSFDHEWGRLRQRLFQVAA